MVLEFSASFSNTSAPPCVAEHHWHFLCGCVISHPHNVHKKIMCDQMHQHFGKIDSGFSLVFTGFQVSGNWETQKPRNRQHTLSKYLLKFKYWKYIVSISMNSIISFLSFQKTGHRFSGFRVSWFSLVFARFPGCST